MDIDDQTRRSRGEVHIKVSVVWDGIVREVVEEVATITISVRHLIIAAVIRRLYTLCWQILIYVKLTYTGVICF